MLRYNTSTVRELRFLISCRVKVVKIKYFVISIKRHLRFWNFNLIISLETNCKFVNTESRYTLNNIFIQNCLNFFVKNYSTVIAFINSSWIHIERYHGFNKWTVMPSCTTEANSKLTRTKYKSPKLYTWQTDCRAIIWV